RQWGVRNLANGVTAFNYYMAFGGTNWGYTGSPSSGFTSYDYGAAITEGREPTQKLAVQKELGAFQHAFPPILSMTPVAPQPLLAVNRSPRTVDGSRSRGPPLPGARCLGPRPPGPRPAGRSPEPPWMSSPPPGRITAWHGSWSTGRSTAPSPATSTPNRTSP